MKNVIKKACIGILATFLLLGATSCGETVTYNPALPTEGQVDDYKQYLGKPFNSTADLSDCQGYKNWYYYCGDPEIEMLDYMVFSEYYGRWCSKYHHLYTYTYMWGTSWLPDGRQGFGIGMGFKAPATGMLDVSVMLNLLAVPELSSGDGVVFTISDKKGNAYESLSIGKQDGGKDIPLETTIEVKKGEEILFMLFANANNTHDFTDVDITINYVEE